MVTLKMTKEQKHVNVLYQKLHVHQCHSVTNSVPTDLRNHEMVVLSAAVTNVLLLNVQSGVLMGMLSIIKDVGSVNVEVRMVLFRSRLTVFK